jgi:5-methylcytosine-specific restriction endonuclease McrA
MIAAAGTAIQSSVLALNRHYAAVHVVSVRRAFCLVFKGAAEIVSVEDEVYQSHDFESWLENSLARAELGLVDPGNSVRTIRFEIEIPRIIRLLGYDRQPKNTIKFNRRNIFLRDEMRCQYCGHRFGVHKLSLDHVLPRSRGGPTNWENIVASCLDCNVRKGGRTPQEAGMKLMTLPRKPNRNPLLFHHLSSQKYACWRTFLRE